ncbi:MAG: phospholipase D-like domain-containing protein, partial [Bdellovibrionota bacterium]
KFGKEVFQRLKKKAQQGVTVRLCVDGYGSSDWADEIVDQKKIPGFEIKIYHPPPWWTPQISQFMHLLYHFNVRNHQKLFLFDNSTAVVGSRNIHEEALQWRETSVEIKENDLLDLRNIFYNLWERSHTQDLKAPRQLKAPKLPVPSPYFYSNQLRELRKDRNAVIRNQLKGAKERILITTPYFMPRRRSLKLLCAKAKAGVKVEIILPFKNDVPISKWLAQSLYLEMLKSGIKIYEYRPGLLHAKTLTVDDWTLVGSSNFNRRSAIRDLEIDYVLRTDKCKKQIIDQFEEDKSNSMPILEVPKMKIPSFVAHLITRIFYSWF